MSDSHRTSKAQMSMLSVPKIVCTSATAQLSPSSQRLATRSSNILGHVEPERAWSTWILSASATATLQSTVVKSIRPQLFVRILLIS
mmetsp:Transcript_41146/g.113085  ORF Transcript_41146/g.113085 Transcript_41146/m.113085 type:complete len:87 (+) Transcript_41146:264-524(+)